MSKIFEKLHKKDMKVVTFHGEPTLLVKTHPYLKDTERQVIFSISRALWWNPALRDDLKKLKLVVRYYYGPSKPLAINRVMKDFDKIEKKTGHSVYDLIMSEHEIARKFTISKTCRVPAEVSGAHEAVNELNYYRFSKKVTKEEKESTKSLKRSIKNLERLQKGREK